MKLFLVMLSVLLTATIWGSALAVTQQLNAARNLEDQLSALTLSERTITSPSVWGELFASLGEQEIERLFAQQGSQDLLTEATEKLLYNAIVEYRNTLRENQAASDSTTLQGLGQAFILDMLIDFDALETSVPAIAEAFVEDLHEGELAADLKSTLSQYLNSLSEDLNRTALSQTASIHRLLQCDSTPQCVQMLTAAQQRHEQRARLIGLGFVLALLAMLTLHHLGPMLTNPGASIRVTTICLLNLSILALLVPGIFVPMMKLKALIEPFTVTIGGASLYFDQQLLLYQNKSIGDLVNLLIETGQPSLFVLAAGMTLFCVLIPVSKCLAAIVLVLRAKHGTAHPALKWLATDSGKWSMADVFVVALIMAYIGMDQLISSHTSAMNTLFDEAQFVQAASASELGMGFYFFVSFVGLSFWTARECKRALEERSVDVVPATTSAI